MSVQSYTIQDDIKLLPDEIKYNAQKIYKYNIDYGINMRNCIQSSDDVRIRTAILHFNTCYIPFNREYNKLINLMLLYINEPNIDTYNDMKNIIEIALDLMNKLD